MHSTDTTTGGDGSDTDRLGRAWKGLVGGLDRFSTWADGRPFWGPLLMAAGATTVVGVSIIFASHARVTIIWDEFLTDVGAAAAILLFAGVALAYPERHSGKAGLLAIGAVPFTFRWSVGGMFLGALLVVLGGFITALWNPDGYYPYLPSMPVPGRIRETRVGKGVGSRRQRFRAWRSERPFWGGTFLVLGGLVVMWVPVSLTHLFLLPGNFLFVGLVFAAMMAISGAFAIFQPRLSSFFGVLGILLSVLSIVGALGGFLVGTLLGILGGAICVAWQPDEAGEPAEDGDEPGDGGEDPAARPDRADVTGDEQVVAAGEARIEHERPPGDGEPADPLEDASDDGSGDG